MEKEKEGKTWFDDTNSSTTYEGFKKLIWNIPYPVARRELSLFEWFPTCWSPYKSRAQSLWDAALWSLVLHFADCCGLLEAVPHFASIEWSAEAHRRRRTPELPWNVIRWTLPSELWWTWEELLTDERREGGMSKGGKRIRDVDIRKGANHLSNIYWAYIARCLSLLAGLPGRVGRACHKYCPAVWSHFHRLNFPRRKIRLIFVISDNLCFGHREFDPSLTAVCALLGVIMWDRKV